MEYNRNFQAQTDKKNREIKLINKSIRRKRKAKVFNTRNLLINNVKVI